MAKCQFCKREFASQQSVRAHLKHCRPYKSLKGRRAVPLGNLSRQTSQEAHLKRLLQGARLNKGPPTVLGPQTRSISGRRGEEEGLPSRSQEQGSQIEDVRREKERRHMEETQKTLERKATEQRIRQVLQKIKSNVVDLYWQWPDVPREAKVQAKLAIEHTLLRLPILDLPYFEIHQIGEAVRDRIYERYHQDQLIQPVQVQKKELTMPMTKVLSGLFICPRCEEEYELDRTPENEAQCVSCHVKLEELDEDADWGDEQTDD